MDNIGTGHWIFAGIFFIAFVVVMIYSYRKDLNRYKKLYSKPWMIILGMILLYAVIYLIYRL